MSGNSIDYRFVREFSDETGANGKTTYEFSGAENLLEQSGFPYAQPIISTWRAGIPKFKRIFKKGTVRRQ
jgi:hypothetical protein